MTEPAAPDHGASYAANQQLWEAWTAVHAAGEFYDLDGFRAGGIRLRDDEVEAVGDVRGQLAPAPAVPLRHRHAVVGPSRCDRDRRRLLAGRHPPRPRDRGGPRNRRRPVRRVEPVRPAGQPRWRLRRRLHVTRRARLAARHPGLGRGRGALRQARRPVLHQPRSTRSPRSSRTRASGPASCALPTRTGSTRDPLVFEVQGSYADPTADVGEQREHGWDHGLGEIVTALIDAGLRLEWLRESPSSTGTRTSSSRPSRAAVATDCRRGPPANCR